MMNMKGYKLILALTVQLFVGVTGALGQGNQLYYNKVDTMELQNRFNLKTDAVGWLTLTPNLGLEFSLGNKNWNQWTVGVYGRANWDVNTRTKSYYVYDIFGARAEVRKYWHAKMPKRAYYIGLYGGANSFDIKFSDIGKKGNSFVGGLMVGMVTQVYGYTNGASLDLELGFSPGVVFADMHDYTRLYKGGKYYYSRTTRDTGYKLTFNPWVYAASVDVVHVSFVYHFGTKLANRYKNRNLIDNDYRLAVEKEKIRRDSVHTVQAKEKRIKMDSLAKADYERRFEEQRLEIERAYTQDSIRQENKALKEKQAVEREEAKHRADSLKEAARIKAMEDKANAKITADSLKFEENAKRTADSLKYAAQERARELKEQKAMERENAKRTADSIKVAQKMEKQQSEADKKKSDSSAPQEDVDTSQTPQVEDTALPKEEKDGQSKENPESKSKDDGQSTEKPVTEEKRAEEKKSETKETKEDHESPEAKPSGENGKSEEGSDNSDNKGKAESGIVKHVGEAKVLVCEKDSRRSLCPFFDANMLKNLNSIGYSSYSGVYLGQIDRNALCAFGDSFSQN